MKTRSKSQGDSSEKDDDNIITTPRGRAKTRGTPRGGGPKPSSNPGDTRTSPYAHTEELSDQQLNQQGPPLTDVQPSESQTQGTLEQHPPTTSSDSTKSTIGGNATQSDTARPSEAQQGSHEFTSTDYFPSAPIATPSTSQTMQTQESAPNMKSSTQNQEVSIQGPSGTQNLEEIIPSQDDFPPPLGATAANYNTLQAGSETTSTSSRGNSLSSFSSLRQDLRILRTDEEWIVIHEAPQLKSLLNRYMVLIQGYSVLKKIRNVKDFERYKRALIKIQEASTSLPQMIDEIFSRIKPSDLKDQLSIAINDDIDAVITKAQEIIDNLEEKLLEWKAKITKVEVLISPLQRSQLSETPGMSSSNVTPKRRYETQPTLDLDDIERPDDRPQDDTPLRSSLVTDTQDVIICSETNMTQHGTRNSHPTPIIHNNDQEHGSSIPITNSNTRSRLEGRHLRFNTDVQELVYPIQGSAHHASQSAPGAPPRPISIPDMREQKHPLWCVCELCHKLPKPPKYHQDYEKTSQVQFHNPLKLEHNAKNHFTAPLVQAPGDRNQAATQVTQTRPPPRVLDAPADLSSRPTHSSLRSRAGNISRWQSVNSLNPQYTGVTHSDSHLKPTQGYCPPQPSTITSGNLLPPTLDTSRFAETQDTMEKGINQSNPNPNYYNQGQHSYQTYGLNQYLTRGGHEHQHQGQNYPDQQYYYQHQQQSQNQHSHGQQHPHQQSHSQQNLGQQNHGQQHHYQPNGSQQDHGQHNHGRQNPHQHNYSQQNYGQDGHNQRNFKRRDSDQPDQRHGDSNSEDNESNTDDQGEDDHQHPHAGFSHDSDPSHWQGLDNLKTKARELERSNKQMRRELEDLGDPLQKTTHQLTDYLRRRDNMTKFSNEHMRKAFNLESQLSKSKRSLGSNLDGDVISFCEKVLDDANDLDMKLGEATSKASKSAREKGLTISQPGSGTDRQLHYPKFSETSENLHLYEWISKMTENFEIMNTNRKMRASILKDNLQGNAKFVINESMKTEDEIKKALMDKYGDMHVIFKTLNILHDKVGAIPGYVDRDQDVMSEIVDKTARHMAIIKRKEMMLTYDTHGSYKSTLNSIEHFKKLKTFLPLSEGAAIHGTESIDPANAYRKIRDVFQRLTEHSGFIYEQLQASSDSKSRPGSESRGRPSTDSRGKHLQETQRPRGRKQESTDIVLYTSAPHKECWVCQLQRAEGIGKDHHKNHLFNKSNATHPSSCPNYLRMGMKGRKDWLQRMKICPFCLKQADNDHKVPFDQCRKNQLNAATNLGYRCITTSCPVRTENCETHKTQNLPRLERRAKSLKEENNIEFIFMGLIHEAVVITSNQDTSRKINQQPPSLTKEIEKEHTETQAKFNLDTTGLTELNCKLKKYTPLKIYLEYQTREERVTYPMSEILLIIKQNIIRENLFDPNNPAIILCSRSLEKVLGMRAMHTSQIYEQIIPQLEELPENTLTQLKLLQRTTTNWPSPETLFTLSPELTKALASTMSGTEGFAQQTIFTFRGVVALTSNYIRSKSLSLFDPRNRKVAIIEDDILGKALGVKALHYSQLANLLLKRLSPARHLLLSSTIDRQWTIINGSKIIQQPKTSATKRQQETNPELLTEPTPSKICKQTHATETTEHNSLSSTNQIKPESKTTQPLPNVKSAPLLWTSGVDNLIKKGGARIETQPEGKAMVLFMYMKGRSRPLATLFDTGCSTMLVKRDVIGTELIATKIAGKNASLRTFNSSSKLLDKYAILVPKTNNQGHHLLEGYVTDKISYLEGMHTQHALQYIKNCNPENQEIQKANVHPQIGGHIDLVIGVRYLNLFPELIYNSSLNLSLHKLRLQSHFTGYDYCLGGNNPFWREIISNSDYPPPTNTPPPVLQRVETTESDDNYVAKPPTKSTRDATDSTPPALENLRHSEPTYCDVAKLKTKSALNTKLKEKETEHNQTNPQNEHGQSQPANEPQSKYPVFIGSYQPRDPTTKPDTKSLPGSLERILRLGSATPSAGFFQALIKGKNRALLTLFSPHHCGIIIRSNLAGKELDAIDQDDTTATILLPVSNGTPLRVKAHIMPQTLDLRIANLKEVLAAQNTQSYLESTTPYKTHPHIDGHADIIIGITHRHLHPKPILHLKTNLFRFQTCLQSHARAYKYCAEGIYHRADLNPLVKIHAET